MKLMIQKLIKMGFEPHQAIIIAEEVEKASKKIKDVK